MRPSLGERRARVNAVGATTVEAPGKRSFRSRIRRRRRTDRGVSFPELVWMHHLRQEELRDEHHRPYEGPAEQRYRDFVERFEAQNGAIVSQYWCTSEASGIALTIKRRPFLLADTVRLHWATDWSTKEKPKLMRLLYECETLAVKVQEVLRDTSRRLAIQSLFNVISFVLAFAETPHAGDDKAVAEISRSTRAGLKEISTFYRHAAERSGQITYVGGMLFGMVPPLLISIAGWIVVGNNHSRAIGIDLANKAGSSYYYVVFSFAAGFSERLAQDMLLGTTLESVVGKRGGKQDKKTDDDPGLTATSV